MISHLRMDSFADELELPDSDSDICDNSTINSIFCTKHKLLSENKIAGDETYILHMDGTKDSNFKLAIATSNNTCEIYHFDNNHLAKIEELEHSHTITGVRFNTQNNNLVYSASVNSIVTLWDLRLPKKQVAEFRDTSLDESQEAKPITCFDVSSNNRLLAAGTELHEGEAFILFWDMRKTNLLGGYWESHTDDITQVHFHPDNMNRMMSGSTDGLINIYDLQETNEEDALTDSLNTESSIEQLLWYNQKGKACISCITHTVDVQLWKTDAAEPYAHFRRANIAFEMKRISEAHVYVAGAHCNVNGEVTLLAGSSSSKEECLRGFKTVNAKLQPLLALKENQQRVRSSWFNEHHNLLVTGGESGILDVWHVDCNNL